MNIVNILENIVFNFNKTHLYDQDQFDFIQLLANRYNKIIISINSNTIQINIPKVNNNTVYYFGVISFLYLDDLAKSNGYNNSDFQNILQNLQIIFIIKYGKSIYFVFFLTSIVLNC
jgi:hypothetical protein